MKQPFFKRLLLLLGLVGVGLFSSDGLARARGPVDAGPALDYQPALLRVQPGGELMLVFERLDPVTQSGDLYVSFSSDGGQGWTSPQAAIASGANERHPALVQLASNSFALFYLKDTGSGAYRLFRATSTNGLDWSEQGQLDLGWSTPGEINPCVIGEADGTLTMVYHRLSGLSYIAQSADGGATWDALKTPVSNGNAQLPRLAKRQSDGLYLVTYQVGSSDLDLYSKASTNPYHWDVPQVPLSTAINSHDSQPIVLEDGTFAVPYAQQVASVFDVYYRLSRDGGHWSAAIQVTDDPTHYDTQPHPLLQGQAGHLLLAWSHQNGSLPYQDHDVWVETDLQLPMELEEVAWTVTPAIGRPGDMVTYTLSLANAGAAPFVVSFTDPLPVGVTYLEDSLWASTGVFSYTSGSDTITWTAMISATADAALLFRATLPPTAADGSHLVNPATLVDGLGISHPLSTSVTLDGLPPESALHWPEPGQVISATQVMVSGLATDTVSGIGQVLVSVDGGAWQTAAGHEAWSFLWADAPQGTHHLRSRAQDGVGWVETPGPGITLTVDSLPPQWVGISPISASLQVPLSATLVITFSEPLITGTLVFAVSPDPGGWQAAWNAPGTCVRLSHAPFAAGQVYRVEVLQARDRAFNALPPFSWQFQTVFYRALLPLVLTSAP